MNQDEYDLIIFGNKSEAIWAKIGHRKIWKSENQKLLRVITDFKLSCDEYLSLCKNTRKKLSALARLAKFFRFEQWTLSMKSVIESIFGYFLFKLNVLRKKY